MTSAVQNLELQLPLNVQAASFKMGAVQAPEMHLLLPSHMSSVESEKDCTSNIEQLPIADTLAVQVAVSPISLQYIEAVVQPALLVQESAPARAVTNRTSFIDLK